jgi:hypothetical protein
MKFILLVALIYMSLLFSGCERTISPKQQAAIDESIPVCNGEIECAAKWAAAKSWVLNNAKSEIQLISDDLIETTEPAKNSSSLAARITKEPTRIVGLYKIDAKVWCDSIWGCTPKRADAILDFNHYVNSAVVHDPSDYKNALKKNNYSKPIMGVSLINEKPIVKTVYSGSPAEKAGIKSQDLLVQIAGKHIHDQLELKNILNEIDFGEEVDVTVMRGDSSYPLILRFPSKNELQEIKKSGKTIDTTAPKNDHGANVAPLNRL